MCDFIENERFSPAHFARVVSCVGNARVCTQSKQSISFTASPVVTTKRKQKMHTKTQILETNRPRFTYKNCQQANIFKGREGNMLVWENFKNLVWNTARYKAIETLKWYLREEAVGSIYLGSSTSVQWMWLLNRPTNLWIFHLIIFPNKGPGTREKALVPTPWKYTTEQYWTVVGNHVLESSYYLRPWPTFVSLFVDR